MVTAEQYWTSYEIGTARGIVQAIRLGRVATRWQRLEKWVWRGQSDASRGLHSTLSQRLFLRNGNWPTERQTVDAERDSFVAAEEWGLGWSTRGRLTALELLALIRHHGSYSRFIDVSSSLPVALFAACHEYPDKDGRIFALDGRGNRGGGTGDSREQQLETLESGRLNETPKWWTSPPSWWSTDYVVWKPPAIDDRIIRQQGAFLIGGSPRTAGNQKWYLRGQGPNSGQTSLLGIADVRSATSLGVRCHTLDGAPSRPVHTFRVAASAKKGILEALNRMFGVSEKHLYPDASGFEKFGQPLP